MRQIDPFSSPYESVHFIWTQVKLPAMVNSIPSPAIFAACVDGNFHGLDTMFCPLRVYEHNSKFSHSLCMFLYSFYLAVSGIVYLLVSLLVVYYTNLFITDKVQHFAIHKKLEILMYTTNIFV